MRAQSGCLVCPPDAIFSGTTFGHTPSNSQGGWCGTIENDLWIAVYPDVTGVLQLDFTTYAPCIMGLQVAITDLQNMSPLTCNGQVLEGNTVRLTVSGQNPDVPLLVRVDGFAGSNANLKLDLLSMEMACSTLIVLFIISLQQLQSIRGCQAVNSVSMTTPTTPFPLV